MPDAAGMDVSLVRQIHQIVDDEAVVAFEGIERAAFADPLGAVVPMEIGHFGGVGEGRVARPHPHHAMALDHGKGAHASRWVDRLLRRHEGAAAFRIELDAVIAALHVVALEIA